jgi:hypothetical protein
VPGAFVPVGPNNGRPSAEDIVCSRVLMAKMASHGCELPLDPPTDPPTHGIDIDIVCAEFFAQTPAKGNEKQKRELRQGRFDRAVERAQKRLLIGVREIGDKTYLWLLQQHPDASKFSREQTRFAVTVQSQQPEIVPKMAIMAGATRSGLIDDKCCRLKHLHEG